VLIIVPLASLPPTDLDPGGLWYYLEVEAETGVLAWPTVSPGDPRTVERSLLAHATYERQQLMVAAEDPEVGELLAATNAWTILDTLDDSDIGLGHIWLFDLPAHLPVVDAMIAADAKAETGIVAPNWVFTSAQQPPPGGCRVGNDPSSMNNAERLAPVNPLPQHSLPVARIRSNVIPFTAHELNTGSGGGLPETVFVADSGIVADHPAFGAPFLDPSLGDSAVIEHQCFLQRCEFSADPGNDHGTRVASIIAANDEMLGGAPDARLVSLRISRNGQMNVFALGQALQFARRRAERDETARIFNFSLGWGSHWLAFQAELMVRDLTGWPLLYHASLVALAWRYEAVIRSADLMFVQSAGHIRWPENTSDNIRDFRLWPSGYFLHRDSSLVVSTANDDGFVVMRSTRSEAVDVSAPATCVVMASRTPAGTDTYVTDDGSSFAAPLGAAALALIRARARDSGIQITARAAHRQLVTTARPMSGSPNAEGAGLMDVGLALRLPDTFVLGQLKAFTPIDDLDVSVAGDIVFTTSPSGAADGVIRAYEVGTTEGPQPLASRIEVGSDLFVVADRLSRAVYVPRVDEILVLDHQLEDLGSLRLPHDPIFVSAEMPARPETSSDGERLYVPHLATVSGETQGVWHLATYQSAGSAEASGSALLPQALYAGPLQGGGSTSIVAIAPAGVAPGTLEDVVFSLEDVEQHDGSLQRHVTARCWDWSEWVLCGTRRCDDCTNIQAAGPGAVVVVDHRRVHLYEHDGATLVQTGLFELPDESIGPTIALGPFDSPAINVFAAMPNARSYMAVLTFPDLTPWSEIVTSGLRLAHERPVRVVPTDPTRALAADRLCSPEGWCWINGVFNLTTTSP
jgi:hypothetical protein